MTPDDFISRWAASGGVELANSQSFLKELCDLLGVEGSELSAGNAVNCGATLEGPVSVVASVVAIHPFPAELVRQIQSDPDD